MHESTNVPGAIAPPALFVRAVDVNGRPHTLNVTQIADLRCWPDKYFHGAVELASGTVIEFERDAYRPLRDAVFALGFGAGRPGPLPLRLPYRELCPDQAPDYLATQKTLFCTADFSGLDCLDRDGRLAFASEVFDEHIWSWRCLTPRMMHVLMWLIESGFVRPGWAWTGALGLLSEFAARSPWASDLDARDMADLVRKL